MARGRRTGIYIPYKKSKFPLYYIGCICRHKDNKDVVIITGILSSVYNNVIIGGKNVSTWVMFEQYEISIDGKWCTIGEELLRPECEP